MEEGILYDETITETDGFTEDLQSSVNSDEEQNNITDEQIISALREVIANGENDLQGDNILSSEDISENHIQGSETVEEIDYTQLLTDIKYELISLNSNITTLTEEYNSTIFDKSLNEYNISNTLLATIVIFSLVKALMYFINHFTPRLWR